MSLFTENRVRIILYREEFKDIFRKINYEWIEKYFQVTDLDKKAFDNPQTEIIDKEGFIFLAQYEDQIVGSAALEKITNQQYALTRMSVDVNYQGKKIGQFLIETAIKKAKELNVNSIVLYTNQNLISALNLYFKNGFRAVPLDYVPYKRATIKMELRIAN